MKPLLFVLVCGFVVSLNASHEKKRLSLWVDLYQGDVITFPTIVHDLSRSRVVYLGETHRIARHHEWQLKIIKSLHKQHSQLLIGLEQIEDVYQKPLDQFNAGKLDFSQLAEEIEWKKRWGNYPSYQEILDFAQKNKIPLVALNAKQEVIRKIGRKGLDALSPEERSLLPQEIQWENDTLYRRLLNKILMVHMPLTEEKLTPVFQAQVSRDEAMAENLVEALKQQDPKTIGVVIAGSGHMNYGLGIPPRVTRRLGEHAHRILFFTNSGDLHLTQEEVKMTRKIEISQDDLRFLQRPKCDYLLVTEASADPNSN
ncbi:MAG: ChaN family lipoprotein [Verrucomicrobiota bacterium]